MKGLLLSGALALLTVGCETAAGNFALGVLGVTLWGGYAPNNEVEQIYYLGVFDPQEQVPQAVYRVRVHGQASLLSNTQFASGWVPAGVIDSLNSTLQFTRTGRGISNGLEISDPSGEHLATLATGRRLVMFGPNGFREAPPNHRLVIVMGSSPQAYFQAVDTALGTVSNALAEQRSAGLSRELYEAHIKVSEERTDLAVLARDVAIAMPEGRN